MFNNETIKLVLQAGAVGLCVLLIWSNYKLSGNHIEHLTASVDKNTQVMSELRDAILLSSPCTK